MNGDVRIDYQGPVDDVGNVTKGVDDGDPSSSGGFWGDAASSAGGFMSSSSSPGGSLGGNVNDFTTRKARFTRI